MPLVPPAIPLGQMDARQQATFFAQAGIQAEQRVRTFTPTWVGFSAAPSGDLSYLDFGNIVVLWNDSATELVGTSNTNEMQITNLPAGIRPSQFKWRDCLIVNNDFTTNGSVGINTDGTLQFFFHQVTEIITGVDGLAPQASGFNTTNSKGVPAGWMVMYSQ